MFTGIIEALGEIIAIRKEGTNVHFHVCAAFAGELKVDQSLSHNGVCLTVVAVSGNQYQVVAIEETLKRSNLGTLAPGNVVNLERCTQLGDRLDGHLVQGHVDTVGEVSDIKKNDGSWIFSITHPEGKTFLTVEKGSVSVNGVSLTVVDSAANQFSVAIIPYTYEHTNFKTLKKGDKVNLEFDIIGKYVARILGER